MTRTCGDCSLCCRLLPVHDGAVVDGRRLPGSLDKAAGERCRYQRHTGCVVYETVRMPMCCKMWNCRWLVNDDTADLSRPDRSHYVIDIMPDFVTMVDNDTGAQQHVEVIQVWIDPRHPDAHRDPALRRYLERQGKAALIRFSNSKAITLLSPALCDDGRWHEIDSPNAGPEHSFQEIAQAIEGKS